MQRVLIAALLLTLLLYSLGYALLAHGARAPLATAAVILPSAQLDNGVCGQNLELGTDHAASMSALPRFLVSNLGLGSIYTLSVDMAPVGTLQGVASGVACLDLATPLQDGTHLLGMLETAPDTSVVIPPFSFRVDTTPPSPVPGPLLYPSGGYTTATTTPIYTGTADPNVQVEIRSGLTPIGSGATNSTGHYAITVGPLATGLYTGTATIRAVAIDEAGNISQMVVATALTVAPPGAGARVVPTSAGLKPRPLSGGSNVCLVYAGDLASTGPISTTWTSVTMLSGQCQSGAGWLQSSALAPLP